MSDRELDRYSSSLIEIEDSTPPHRRRDWNNERLPGRFASVSIVGGSLTSEAGVRAAIATLQAWLGPDQRDAEIARLTAELAAAREAAQRDRDVAQAMAKAAHEAEEQLAAVRAVPADVEAAIWTLRRAEANDVRASTGQSLAACVLAEGTLRAAIARAIATAATPPPTVDAIANTIRCAFAGDLHVHDYGLAARSVLALFASTTPPPTVGGLPATAPVDRCPDWCATYDPRDMAGALDGDRRYASQACRDAGRCTSRGPLPKGR